MNVAVYYGSTYGNTADAAERIAARLTRLLHRSVPVHEAGWGDARRLAGHDVLIIGCSTWDGGELQAGWRAWFDDLAFLDLTGKRVALFGTGDPSAYPTTFVDALGILAERFEARGARIVGQWPVVGYEHVASRAQRGDAFVGLALDYDDPDEVTSGRISAWTDLLRRELERERPAVRPPGVAAP